MDRDKSKVNAHSSILSVGCVVPDIRYTCKNKCPWRRGEGRLERIFHSIQLILALTELRLINAGSEMRTKTTQLTADEFASLAITTDVSRLPETSTEMGSLDSVQVQVNADE